MAPSDTPQGPLAVDCDHHYESRIKGGEPIAVRLCTWCRQPDWTDLASEASKVYQRGWEEGSAHGGDPYMFVPPLARHTPKAALDSATRGAEMIDTYALTPAGRNLLAHALVQLRQDGWLREAQAPSDPTAEDSEHAEEVGPDDTRTTDPLTDLQRQSVGWEAKYFEMVEKRTVAATENQQLRHELDEARSWARHGYEIGQRHCGWTDHGVAPDWLTEGWPRAIDTCDHLKQAVDLDARLTAARAVVHRWSVKVHDIPAALFGDVLHEIATALGISNDDVRRYKAEQQLVEGSQGHRGNT